MSWTRRCDSRPQRVGWFQHVELDALGLTVRFLYLGIWMCRAQGANIMIMDVEGTDGRERGEDQVRSFPAAL